MERPDLTTLACVNSECQHYGQSGQNNLVIRKVYGRDRIRFLRCGSCQDEFSERRGTALFNTKLSESKAIDIIDHLDEGCSVRSTSRLTRVAKETVARLLKVSGRHAQRFHDQEVHNLRPRALEGSVRHSCKKLQPPPHGCVANNGLITNGTGGLLRSMRY